MIHELAHANPIPMMMALVVFIIGAGLVRSLWRDPTVSPFVAWLVLGCFAGLAYVSWLGLTSAQHLSF